MGLISLIKGKVGSENENEYWGPLCYERFTAYFQRLSEADGSSSVSNVEDEVKVNEDDTRECLSLLIPVVLSHFLFFLFIIMIMYAYELDFTKNSMDAIAYGMYVMKLLNYTIMAMATIAGISITYSAIPKKVWPILSFVTNLWGLNNVVENMLRRLCKVLLNSAEQFWIMPHQKLGRLDHPIYELLKIIAFKPIQTLQEIMIDIIDGKNVPRFCPKTQIINSRSCALNSLQSISQIQFDYTLITAYITWLQKLINIASTYRGLHWLAVIWWWFLPLVVI